MQPVHEYINKVLKIIDSCETKEQLRSAKNVVLNLHNMLNSKFKRVTRKIEYTADEIYKFIDKTILP